MILTLSVHPSRFADLLTLDRMRLDPPIPANTYHDSFGNFCHVIRAPAGRLTVSTDFLIRDDGEPDATAPQAEQSALEDLPVEVLIYLLGSRYCETDRLSNTAWSLLGRFARGGRWCRRSAIMSTIASPSAMPMQARPRRLRRLYGEAGRVPRLRSPCGHALPLHERTGALLHRLSWRHRRAA